MSFAQKDKPHTFTSVLFLPYWNAGDIPAKDPVHSLVHSADAEPLSESAAVVLCVHAVWGRDTCPMGACGGH